MPRILLSTLVTSLFCIDYFTFASAWKLPSSNQHTQASLLRNAQLLLNKEDIPSERQWITIDERSGLEFQSGSNDESDPRMKHIRRSLGFSNGMQTDMANGRFVDGSETYYDDYAQAWRVLGFYLDCDACSDEGVDANGNAYNGNCYAYDNGGFQNRCQRYLLWAAYVDLDYEGGGAREYQFYDRHSNQWYDTACQENSRCVKMDCHLPSTHWSLLGYFKEPNYDQWMDELFTSQGGCVWTESEFELMQQSLEQDDWPPTQCTRSEVMKNGYYLYYDMKPDVGGNMTIGLYIDSSCSVEWDSSGSTTTYEDVIYYNNDDDDCGDDGCGSLVEVLKAWNEAFDVFKQCQPCKAYDLTSIVAGVNYQRNSSYYDDASDDEEAYACKGRGSSGGFQGGVNQCKMFRTNTTMMTATFQDVALAEQQGTITGALPEYGFREEVFSPRLLSGKIIIGFLLVGATLFFFNATQTYRTALQASKNALKVPLTSGYNMDDRGSSNSRGETNSSGSVGYSI